MRDILGRPSAVLRVRIIGLMSTMPPVRYIYRKYSNARDQVKAANKSKYQNEKTGMYDPALFSQTVTGIKIAYDNKTADDRTNSWCAEFQTRSMGFGNT